MDHNKNELSNKNVIVLILSYNGKHLLDDSISSYLDNDYSSFQVVVVDNGSTDNTKEYVESKWPEVKVLRTEKNLKYSGGFNFGLDYAFNKQKADYVLITNNDVLADKKIISSCVDIVENKPNVGFVIGKVYYFDNKDIFQTCGREWDENNWRGKTIGFKEKDVGQYNEIKEVAWCDDIFWLVNGELYGKVGGYNVEFAFQAEDFEWQVRAKNEGYKIYYTPHAKLWHKESMTIGKVSAFKAYYDFRNPLIVHMMYRSFSEYKFYYRLKRKTLFKTVIKSFVKFKLYYLFKCFQGFTSAISWGLKNNKITLIQIFY